MPTLIKVDLALIQAKPPLCALADVILRWDDGELMIRRFAVFQKAEEPAWASLPRLSIQKNGKKAYVDLLDLPRGLKERVLDAVLDEYRSKLNAR